MFAALLGWIPVIGPIVQGIVDYFNKKEDTKVQLDKNDVGVIASRNQVIIATKDVVGIKVCRDFAMWFPITYVNIYIWDRMVDIPHPEWVWGVRPLDLQWQTILPVVAVYAFLFGLAFRGR